MRKNLKALIAVILAALLFLLPGCGRRGKGDVSSVGGGSVSSDPGSASQPGDGQNPGDDGQGGEAGSEEPGGAAGDENGGENSGGDDGEAENDVVDPVYADYVKEEYTYRDYILNRKNSEGKFAVFFFRSDLNMSTFTGASNSGDNTFIIAPDGTTMLIDMNTTGCVSYAIDSIKKLGVKKIDYLVVSHAHEDHMGGYKEVFGSGLEIKRLYTTGSLYFTQGNGMYTELFKTADDMGVPRAVLEEGDKFGFGPAEVEILFPFKGHDWEASYKEGNLNNESMCMRITYKKASFFFGGDIGDAGYEQRQMIQKYGERMRCDVVKMNHHGVAGNNPTDWIDFMKPKIAVGMADSPPSPGVILAYAGAGAATFHTGLDGTVLVTTDGGGTYDIQVEKDRQPGTSFTDLIKPVNGHITVKAG